VLRHAAPVAFVATTDAERARAFYEDTLELELVADEPFALVFDLAGTVLRIAKVERLAPQPHTVLGWLVDDVDAAVDWLVARGVEPVRYAGLEQDERAIWNSPGGARIAWFRDPDDNTLSVTQAEARSPL
jgi:catechol 2,3-dioxygenase-like lactoylglutathione lyase family enzyme